MGAISRISALGVQGVGEGTRRAPGAGTVDAGVFPSPFGPATTAELSSDKFSRSELLAMNAGIDEASRTSNALSTASDAIGVIGGLLGNIHSVLQAAGSPNDGEFDSSTEQTRIDSAVTTIDAIATSSRFGGQQLLDGAFSITTPAGAARIPSFVSSSLGGSNGPGGSSTSLFSLVSGGANDLASGNLDAAGRVVTTAMSQVGQTRAQISQFLSASRPPAGEVGVDPDAADSAALMFADPSTASSAAANSPAQRVLALLG